MALLIKPEDRRRVSPPHKPDEWIELRPIGAGDIDGFEVAANGQVRVTRELLASVITRWSDEEPVDLETIKRLDLDTFTWLCQEALAFSGVRDDEKKGPSNGGLSPTPRRPRPPSPKNSSTSVSSPG